jgi:hypothetical protein
MILSNKVKWPVWDKCRHAIFNLSDGKLEVSGSPVSSIDTEFTYILALRRKDGRKPTKAQVQWAETVIEAIEYVVMSI